MNTNAGANKVLESRLGKSWPGVTETFAAIFFLEEDPKFENEEETMSSLL